MCKHYSVRRKKYDKIPPPILTDSAGDFLYD